jgi:membrane associated rhomboid family serine protease
MKIDHAGHLGGYATGILAALAIKHRARQRKEATEVEEKGMEFNDSHGNGQM